MENLANITSLEVGAVSVGMLLFFVCPAFLGLADQRRRRRLQAAHDRELAVIAATAEPSEPVTEGIPLSPSIPEEIALDRDMVAAVSAPTTLPPESGVTLQAPQPLEIQPADGVWRHSFRLQDLHEARLPEWPPAAIRDDPERDRLWHEGEHVGEQHRDAMLSAMVHSPYPARARFLGAIEADGPKLRLHFLLFPVVWPVSQNQAVAQAVFDIDPGQDVIRGWVDALQAHELTEENRRDIRACGGDAA